MPLEKVSLPLKEMAEILGLGQSECRCMDSAERCPMQALEAEGYGKASEWGKQTQHTSSHTSNLQSLAVQGLSVVDVFAVYSGTALSLINMPSYLFSAPLSRGSFLRFIESLRSERPPGSSSPTTNPSCPLTTSLSATSTCFFQGRWLHHIHQGTEHQAKVSLWYLTPPFCTCVRLRGVW